MGVLAKLMEKSAGGLKAYWGGGNWVDSNRPGNIYNSGRAWDYFEPQTSINYGAVAGDLWRNSAIQACINWITRAWPESYPCVKEEKDDKKVPASDHPLNMLLENPSPRAYDDTVLWAGTILSFWIDGNAYWGINRLKNGDIGEFVYIPHDAIVPKREQNSMNPGPDYFELSQKGIPRRIPVENIVHFRFGVDPLNDLLGMSAWKSVNRHVFTDNEATNYTATTLNNGGSAWMIVAPKDKDAVFDDTEKIGKSIKSKTSRDARGGIIVLDGATEILKPPTLRDQMIDGLHRIPETRICALAGIPAITVGLASGLERSTFNNVGEAEGAAWNTIVAVQRMMGRQLTRQLLRPRGDNELPMNFFQFERANRTRVFWAGFDYSEVRALQPDKQKEWTRVGEAYDRDLLDEDEARAEMGYPPFTSAQIAARQQRQAEAMQAQQEATAGGTSRNGNGTGTNGTAARNGKALTVKEILGDDTPAPSLDWAARVVAEIEALHGEAEREAATP